MLAQDDPFDFHEFLDLPSDKSESREKVDTPTFDEPLDMQTEVETSYLLVNALLNLLVEKGIIRPVEIQNILLELKDAYSKRKKGSG